MQIKDIQVPGQVNELFLKVISVGKVLSWSDGSKYQTLLVIDIDAPASGAEVAQVQLSESEINTYQKDDRVIVKNCWCPKILQTSYGPQKIIKKGTAGKYERV